MRPRTRHSSCGELICKDCHKPRVRNCDLIRNGNYPAACGTFRCSTCKRTVGWCQGGDDNRCAACWLKKPPVEVPFVVRHA